MSNTKTATKPANTKLLTAKAIVALLVLASGTIYSFVQLAQDNQLLTVVAGVALVFFCLSSILDRMFFKN